jgi:hypothetical protein
MRKYFYRCLQDARLNRPRLSVEERALVEGTREWADSLTYENPLATEHTNTPAENLMNRVRHSLEMKQKPVRHFNYWRSTPAAVARTTQLQ